MPVLLLLTLFFVFAASANSKPPERNAVALQERLRGAVEKQKNEFQIFADEYYFNSAPFLISNARNMTITFEYNTTLWFEIGAGVRFENCNNLVVQGNNVIIDYDPLPFYQGTVIDSDKHVFTIKTDIGFPEPDDFYNQYINDQANEFIQGPQFWAAQKNFSLLATNFEQFNANTQITKTLEKHIYKYTPSVSTVGRKLLSVGDKISFVIRLGFTYHLHKCEHIQSHNVVIHSSSYMAITEFDGIGYNVYNNMKVIRRQNTDSFKLCGRKQQRLCLATVSANADVFHSSGMKFGPIVRNSEFSYAMDDYFNVHSRVQISFGKTAMAKNNNLNNVANKTMHQQKKDTIKLLIADPRLVRDHYVADDDPYGTAETMTNAKVGDQVNFRDMNTLKLISTGTICSKPIQFQNGTDDTVQKVEALLKNINRNNNYLHPPFNPLEIIGKNVINPRLWEVEVVISSSTPDEGNNKYGPHNNASTLDLLSTKTVLFELSEWNNSGSIFENNFLHNSIDGLRFKSSSGIIRNNVWKDGNRSLTGLEITPLRSYLEGPLGIENVTITNNSFINCNPNTFITQCTGMSHRAQPTFSSCSNIKRINNHFTLAKANSLPIRRAPTNKLNVHFEPPVLVHRSFNGQHAWFSSILCPDVSGLSDKLLLTMSLGGDGTGCPPPGGAPQNCSMTQYTNNGGKNWQKVYNWGHVNINEVVSLDDGSFIALGYGTKFVPGSDNKTAIQGGWRGILHDNGTVIQTEQFTIKYTSKEKKWPPRFVRSGSVVATNNGWITTMYGHGEGKYHTRYTQRPAVYVVQTTHGYNYKRWSLISTIEWQPEMGHISDGPGEPSMTRLMNDGRILMVFRADSMKPYWKTYSNDDGHTWTKPVPMISTNYQSQWSVKPRLRQVPNQPLLILAGGRPGIFLWISDDFGETWLSHNIAAIHNENLQPTKNVPNVTKLKFNEQVVQCKNYTDHRAIPQPATSSYFGVSFSKDNSLVLSYDRLSDGWHGATENGTWGNFDALFTMRIQFN
jgi:hypothetical protein